MKYFMYNTSVLGENSKHNLEFKKEKDDLDV